MYARRFRCRNHKWVLMSLPLKSSNQSTYGDCSFSQLRGIATACGYCHSQDNSFRTLLDSFSCPAVAPCNNQRGSSGRSKLFRRNWLFRFYSSKGDGRNASEEKHAPVKGVPSFGKATVNQEKLHENVQHFNLHAQLGEEEQKEWLRNEKQAMESKKNHSPFQSRREKFKKEFLQRVIPWENIKISWETFPYYIHEHTKQLLVECVSSHLKHKKFTAAYGSCLASSSGRILLQSVPGTELYRERLAKALVQDLQVPLLILDNRVLAPSAAGDDCLFESELEDGSANLSDECMPESEVEDENGAAEEEWTGSSDAQSESDEDKVTVRASAEALKKLVPFDSEELEKIVSNDFSDSSNPVTVEHSVTSQRPLKKGDRVKYIGPSIHIEADKRVALGKIWTMNGSKKAYTIICGRPLSSGQCGEVYEVNGDQVAVILDSIDSKANNIDKNDGAMDQVTDPSVIWIDVKDIKLDLDFQSEDCCIAMEVMCEVLKFLQPLIVYFPDSSQWFSRAVPKSNKKEFVHRVKKLFDQLPGSVVLICGQNNDSLGSNEKKKPKMLLPYLGPHAKRPVSLKQFIEGLKEAKQSDNNDIYKLFTNVLHICPPKDEEHLKTFSKLIEADRRFLILRSNMYELIKVLEEHELACTDLLDVNTDGVILNRRKAAKVVGWAKNHCLSANIIPSIKRERLLVPRESLETAILRLKEDEAISKNLSQNLKNIAKDEHESNFISAVVAPDEIGVKFDDVGALEDVKNALNELVILPMKRPELFSHGNLLRPCKGILLFGPPGTGKTLLAKALATEAGANFISITGSTLTSKWFGDAEKLTKALFSFATKLAPIIIFVDEIDSLLGARGGAFEHEATRRMRNEFMAAWDGLRSKDSQRILILGATNRPFDLDDAVIRRLPRRIFLDLPDAENRLKILKILLAQENLVPGFEFGKLSNATEGYSGSDLKNLCIAAAYRPVQEILAEERMVNKNDAAPVLRPLNLVDFLESKAKVGPSVAYDATSMNELRKWNEQYGEGGSRTKCAFGFGG